VNQPGSESAKPRILLTGMTGYIGGLLLGRFEQEGIPVRCLVRRPHRILRPVSSTTEVVRGDVLQPESLRAAFDGISTAYYFVHSLDATDFARQDAQAAQNFAAAAREAGVQRIIYLGGLGGESRCLSPHLQSRHEVGRIFRTSDVETIEFRAAIVLGSGSFSFQLIRSLTEQLPVLLFPRCADTPTQPIAIDDVLAYLLAARELPPGNSRLFEIGGRDVVTYADLLDEYARQRGLRRVIVRVPVLPPSVASLWLGFIAPGAAAVGRQLLEGLCIPTIVRDHSARQVFPQVKPMGFREAMQRAISGSDVDAAVKCRVTA